MEVVIYSDGACYRNGYHRSVGSYGAILTRGDKHKEISGVLRIPIGEIPTTISKMEIIACIKPLEILKCSKETPVIVYTDSQYVVKCFNKEWHIHKNKDLWEEFRRVASNFNVSVKWMKGHAGNYWQERADELACNALNEALSPKELAEWKWEMSRMEAKRERKSKERWGNYGS